jgi:hypothetical protein
MGAVRPQRLAQHRLSRSGEVKRRRLSDMAELAITSIEEVVPSEADDRNEDSGA